MSIHIREADIDDLELILRFNSKLCTKENQEFDSTVNPRFATSEAGRRYFTNSITSETGLVLIAENNNKSIGYLVCNIEQVSEYRNVKQMCEVDNMWVDEQYRNQSIGKQLLEAALIWAEQHNIERMRVIASAENIQAINFYKREGFDEYDLILEKDI